MIDDSIVRGTTSVKIVKMMYEAGAKEVHLRIACPQIKFPDYYGVDTPDKNELLASNKNLKEMCKFIGVDSLEFLSIDGLYRAMGHEKRNKLYPQYTDHYFTGDYPVEPSDSLKEDNENQLSLLTSRSS